MKHLSMILLLFFISVAAFSANGKKRFPADRILLREAKVCDCRSFINYQGYSFELYVAYESQGGTCDPCSATGAYGAIYLGNSLVMEGEPTAYGFFIACGANYCG